jgi:hypothetical protein
MPAGEEIGIGAGDAVEELAEDHHRASAKTEVSNPRNLLRTI